MSMRSIEEASRSRPLRLWPGVVLVSLQWLLRFGLPAVRPESIAMGMMGSILVGLLVLVWWAFFSRAAVVERWSAVALIVAVVAGVRLLVHESVRTAGMGVLYFTYVVPVVCLALVAWAVATRRLDGRARLATLVATVLFAGGAWTLVRIGGFTQEVDSDFAFRWAKTPEERLLETAGAEAHAVRGRVPQVEPGGGAWSGFRGDRRDSVVRGVRIETDWSETPPVELWRRAVGPGWSSFAVAGGLVYTQEQRGEDEVVGCYELATGRPVWLHHDRARFWEANAGAGPRATPALGAGRVYSLGATGILNALDAATGDVLWSRDAAADTGAKLPAWAFAGSPLVVGDLVVVAASGALAGYEAATGRQRWVGPAGGEGYSSPQLVTIDGVRQILMLSGDGLSSVAPKDGSTLWEHAWPGYPIVQPALAPGGDVLISANQQSGLRRLSVAAAAGATGPVEVWTSTALKPYYGDFVTHAGHAYGFDGSRLASIRLEDGKRNWKGGRYGSGQLLLLADQGVLLVLSEQGELALVEASPDGFAELARFAAIEGKTWNHPALAGDVLLVRNAEEMAAFRLPLAGD